jgi:meiotically up-regulated gene 157 (Mug157) protein
MHFHVPGNMFAVVALGFIQEIATTLYHDAQLAKSASDLATVIDDAIHKHAVVERGGHKIYAYEVCVGTIAAVFCIAMTWIGLAWTWIRPMDVAITI